MRGEAERGEVGAQVRRAGRERHGEGVGVPREAVFEGGVEAVEPGQEGAVLRQRQVRRQEPGHGPAPLERLVQGAGLGSEVFQHHRPQG